MLTDTIEEFRQAVRAGRSWRGIFPCYWLMANGAAAPFTTNRQRMLVALGAQKPRDPFRPVALCIDWSACGQ